MTTTTNKRKKEKKEINKHLKKEARSGNDEYMKNEGYHGMGLFTCFDLFVDPPFFSNALKKVCGHCGMIYICLDEHCVEKRFWKLYLFLLERELCFSCFISSLEA